MFERKISSVNGMDETVSYSITFTGEYVKQHPTIEEFVYYVLDHNKDEWGTFRIEVEDTSDRKQAVYMKYKFGKLEDPPACYFACLSEYGKLRIKSVKASGGWSSMDYDIEYETSDVKQPDIPKECENKMYDSFSYDSDVKIINSETTYRTTSMTGKEIINLIKRYDLQDDVIDNLRMSFDVKRPEGKTKMRVNIIASESE